MTDRLGGDGAQVVVGRPSELEVAYVEETGVLGMQRRVKGERLLGNLAVCAGLERDEDREELIG